jgi:purine-nucleoside phosphorylase
LYDKYINSRNKKEMIEKITSTVAFLKARGIILPEVGIILGTGLGKLVDHICIHTAIDYADIPDFQLSTVEFHKGRLIYGEMEGKMVMAMQGRYHYYEGYSLEQIIFPIRVMKMLGVQHLLLSNAGGALNLGFRKGELMLLTDHINLLPSNPLTGKNEEELGPRFPDMSKPYSDRLNSMLSQIAQKEKILLHKGTYVAVSGPNLETPAEYRFLRIIGADVVGMSTVPEAIAANHIKMPCCAISVLTDECDPDNLAPVDISEIIATATVAEEFLIKLFRGLIAEL